MSEKRANSPQSGDLLGGLPRARPHRRSTKRPARAGATPRAKPASSSPKPAASTPGAPGLEVPRQRRPSSSRRREPPQPAKQPGIVATAVQAAAEIGQIGVVLGVRAVRRGLSRLPRP